MATLALPFTTTGDGHWILRHWPELFRAGATPNLQAILKLLKTEVGRYAGVVLQFADHGWNGSGSEYGRHG